MATDPIPALLAVAKQTPDPRAIARWVDAYLGTRPLAAKLSALSALEAAFAAKQGDAADGRAAGMVVRIVQRMRGDLSVGAVTKGKGKGRGK